MSEGKCDRYLPTAHPGSGSRGTGASPGSSAPGGTRPARGALPSRGIHRGHSPSAWDDPDTPFTHAHALGTWEGPEGTRGENMHTPQAVAPREAIFSSHALVTK